jgi:hypothetical protein
MITDDYTKEILDKVITDATAMEYSNGDTVFGTVTKMSIVPEESFPLLEVLPVDFQTIERDLTFDTNQDTFRFYVYVPVEADSTNAEANTKLDTLLEIKGRLQRYIKAIPNNLEHEISGIQIYDVEQTSGEIVTLKTERGIELVLTITFNTKIKVNVKTEY